MRRAHHLLARSLAGAWVCSNRADGPTGRSSRDEMKPTAKLAAAPQRAVSSGLAVSRPVLRSSRPLRVGVIDRDAADAPEALGTDHDDAMLCTLKSQATRRRLRTATAGARRRDPGVRREHAERDLVDQPFVRMPRSFDPWAAQPRRRPRRPNARVPRLEDVARRLAKDRKWLRKATVSFPARPTRLVPNPANLAPHGTKPGTCRVKLRMHGMRLGTCWTSFGRHPTRLGTCATSLGKRPTRLGTCATSLGDRLSAESTRSACQAPHGWCRARSLSAATIPSTCGTLARSRLSARPMPGTSAPARSFGGAKSS